MSDGLSDDMDDEAGGSADMLDGEDGESEGGGKKKLLLIVAPIILLLGGGAAAGVCAGRHRSALPLHRLCGAASWSERRG